MPPYTARSLAENLEMERLAEEKQALKDAETAVEKVTDGYPVPDSHGQAFSSSNEALDYVQHSPITDPYEDLGIVGLIYGETIVRHASGEAHWDDDSIVEQMSKELLDAIVAMAEERAPTIDVSRTTAPREQAFVLAASLAVAQNAAFRGMRDYTRGMDLKKLQKDMRKAGKIKDRLTPLEGRDRWFPPIAAAGGFIVHRVADVPNLGTSSLVTGALVGVAAEGARRGMAYSNEHGTSRSARQAAASSRKSGRIQALIGIQDGKPEALKKLAITFFKSFGDDTGRADPLERAVHNALRDRYELLTGAVKEQDDTTTDRDDGTKAKKAWEVLWRSPKRLAMAGAVGAVCVTVGVAISEMIGDGDEAPAAPGAPGAPAGGGTTPVTGGEGPAATVATETDQYCFAEDGDPGNDGMDEFLPARPDEQLGSQVVRDGRDYVVVSVLVTSNEGPAFSINCLQPIG